MGSSVRKTSAKIKKMLQEVTEANPTIDCKEVIPQVAEQTLRSKKTKNYFGDKDFVVLAGGGFACFKKASEVGFVKFCDEYEIKYEKVTLIEVQKIIGLIIDEIEEEKGDINSSIILTAFQSAMTEMLLNELTDPIKFLFLFCSKFIAMVIREDINEELSAAFKNVKIEDVDKRIKDYADEYVKNNFEKLIEQCGNNEIQIEELIQKMQAVL